MAKFHVSFFAAAVLSLLATVASAGQTWQGAQVMPKSEGAQIQDENGLPVSLYDISWPATVQKTKGRFLWVQDEGGYSRNQAGGWIYADDAVKLDDAHDYYTDELRKGETPWLDWMCGISWENKSEPGIAAQYYQNVLTLAPNTRIDDVHIRLGRMLAQQQLQSGRGRYNPALRAAWEQHFKTAQTINSTRPQLYYEWGFALSQACSCAQAKEMAAQAAAQEQNAKSTATSTSDASTGAQQSHPASTESIAAGIPTTPGAEAAIQALTYYEYAEKLNPRWWRIPLARAELILNQCDGESPECPGERTVIAAAKPEFFTQIAQHCHHKAAQIDNVADNTTSAASPTSSTAEAAVPPYMNDVLAAALDDFNRSISLNTNALDAYRDRAEVLRLQRRLSEAEQSAVTACKLCYYRQAGSLRTLAQINHDLQLYQPAADYALRAAELASGDEQQRFLKLWYKCSQQCSPDNAKIAVASAAAGYVASRGDDDDTTTKKPPAHVEPPPGFLSRASSAVPE